MIANRALVRATDGAGLDVDFTPVMAGFAFATVWAGRRIFRVGEVEIPVARLTHIVESKRRAGRDKDRLFLITHAEALRDLIESDEPPASRKRKTRAPGQPRGRRKR